MAKRIVSTLPEIRARHGRMSLADVFRSTGIAVSTLSKMETGKSKGVDFETLVKLCALFDLEPGAFFRLDEISAAEAAAPP